MTNNDDSRDSTTNNSKSGPEQTRRSLLAAAGVVGVLGPAAALSIGKTAPEPKVTVDSPACNRVRVTNVGSVDVRIRIEGPNGVRVPETGGLILAPAERHTLNVASVDGVRGTYTVYDDEEDVVLGAIDHETCVTYYQVQFVTGPPKEALGRTQEDFYDRENRLIRYLHGSSKEPVTSGGRPGDDAVPAKADSCLTMDEGI